MNTPDDSFSPPLLPPQGSLAQILNHLASRPHITRVQQAQHLREFADPNALWWSEFFRRGLEDKRHNARAETARLASHFFYAPVVPKLAQLTASPHEPLRVRKAAAQALGRLGDAKILPALATLANHSAMMARRTAVEAAGRLETPEAFGILGHALHDRAWEVRLDAIIGLGGLPAPASSRAWEVLNAHVEIESQARLAAFALRSLAELAQHHPPVRKATTERFVQVLQSPENALHHNHQLRKAAARGLGELRSQPSRLLLQATARDPWAEVAQQALWALHQLSHTDEDP